MLRAIVLNGGLLAVSSPCSSSCLLAIYLNCCGEFAQVIRFLRPVGGGRAALPGAVASDRFRRAFLPPFGVAAPTELALVMRPSCWSRFVSDGAHGVAAMVTGPS